MGEAKYVKYNKINESTYEFVEECLPGDRRCFTGFVDKASYQNPRLNKYLSSGIVISATPYFNYFPGSGIDRWSLPVRVGRDDRFDRLANHLFSQYVDHNTSRDDYTDQIWEIANLFRGEDERIRRRLTTGDLSLDEQYKYSNNQILARSTIDYQSYVKALEHMEKNSEPLSDEQRRLVRNLFTTVEKLGKDGAQEREYRRLAGTLMVIKPLDKSTPVFSQEIQDYVQESKDGKNQQTRQRLKIIQATNSIDHNSIDHLYGVEYLAATDHDDFIDLTGTDMIQGIATGSGNDTLYNGNYLYSGFDGHSEGMNIDMGEGDDVLFMQRRPRNVYMGSGNDTLYIDTESHYYGYKLLTDKFDNPSRISYRADNGENLFLNVNTIIDMGPGSDLPRGNRYTPDRDVVIISENLIEQVKNQYEEYLDAHRAAEQLADMTTGNVDGNMYNKIMQEYFKNDKLSMVMRGVDLFQVELRGIDRYQPRGDVDDYTSKMEKYQLNFSTPYLNDIKVDDDRLSRTFFLEDYRKMFKTVFRADAGIDFSVKGAKKSVVIIGSENSDIIKSGSGDDLIYGGSGRDVIHPGSGNDIVVLGGEHATSDIQVNNQLKLSQGHHFLAGNVNDFIKLRIELTGDRKPIGWKAHGKNNVHYTLFWKDGSLTIPNFLRLMANRYIDTGASEPSVSEESLEIYSKHGADGVDRSFSSKQLKIEESSQLTYDVLQSAGPLEEALHCDSPNCFTPTIAYAGVLSKPGYHGRILPASPRLNQNVLDAIISDVGRDTFYFPKFSRVWDEYSENRRAFEEYQGFSLFHKDNDWFMGSEDYVIKWSSSMKRGRGVSHAVWKDPHYQRKDVHEKFSWIHESNMRYNGPRSLFFLGEFDSRSSDYGVVAHRNQLEKLPLGYRKLIKEDLFAEVLSDGVYGFEAMEGEIRPEEKEFIDYVLGYEY